MILKAIIINYNILERPQSYIKIVILIIGYYGHDKIIKP